jgi:hypothetical protein
VRAVRLKSGLSNPPATDDFRKKPFDRLGRANLLETLLGISTA